MTGATITPTGTPAFASVSIACSRRFGVEARGSSTRASSGSSVGIERCAEQAPSAASSMKRSTSRVIRWFLVITLTGLRASTSTSRQRRVMRSLRSIGW